jgi:hypothetical protein
MRVRDSAAGTPLTAVDATISATVKGLAAARDLSPDDVATGIGMNRSTYYRRLAGGFSAADVAALADFFGVSVIDLYDGLGGRLCASTRQYVHNLRSSWGLAA